VLTLKWWFVDDVTNVLARRIGDHPCPRPRGRELAALVFGKAVFLGWALVVPALVYGSAWVIGYFVLGAFVLGVVLSTVFQLAHTVPEAEFHAAADGGARLPAGWAEHQVRATVDFAPSSRVLTWYLGGLNFQIEHHLFAGVCHVHYPALAAIVEETCRQHGIPYRVHRTAQRAIAAHQRHLRLLGRDPGKREPDEPAYGARALP
jgi:linoleoyl-CoA desaturase